MIDLDAVAAALGGSLVVEEQVTTGASNVTWRASLDGRAVVVRHPPAGPTLPTAHDLGREARFLRALGGTGVPVPEVVASCDDPSVAGAPFLVLERLPGVCLLAGPVPDLDAPALARAAVDTLAAIHAVDWAERGLESRPGSFPARQVERWRRQLDATPTAARLDGLDLVHDWLVERLPSGEDRTVIHGDYGFHNLLVDRDEVTGVLDWELATVGDPLTDVMGLTKSWGADSRTTNPANDAVALAPGAPTADELVERYEAKTGRSFGPDRPFYEVLALWKTIGVLEGIHARSGGTSCVSEPIDLVARTRTLIAHLGAQGHEVPPVAEGRVGGR